MNPRWNNTLNRKTVQLIAKHLRAQNKLAHYPIKCDSFWLIIYQHYLGKIEADIDLNKSFSSQNFTQLLCVLVKLARFIRWNNISVLKTTRASFLRAVVKRDTTVSFQSDNNFLKRANLLKLFSMLNKDIVGY